MTAMLALGTTGAWAAAGHGHDNQGRSSQHRASHATGAPAESSGNASGQGSSHTAGAPPGNNGTIKIDQSVLVPGSPVDHANHPHVSCQFALSFFGFDAGTDTAQVTFTAQPPTGKFTPINTVLGPSQLQFSVAQRTGGGQLDASVPYQLDVTGLTPSAQGFHVRVTVDVSGAKNADGKQKVFWYQPCASAPATGPSSGGPTPPTSNGPAPSTAPTGSAGTTAAASGTLHSARPGAGASGSVTSPAAAGSPVFSPATSSGALPTGAAADLGPFAPGHDPLPGIAWWEIIAGSLLLTSGTALAAWRMRRRAA